MGEDRKKALDAAYRDEGWGKITDATLAIRPSNVESQARDVARWAHGEISRQAERLAAAEKLIRSMLEAKALAGVREQVAAWNGEGKPDGPYPKHPQRLGATLPKTNCGAVYELDDTMQAARAFLDKGGDRG